MSQAQLLEEAIVDDGRMTEADLYQIAILRTKDRYEPQFKRMTILEMNETVNAYASGFYMGARFVETPRHRFDWIPDWWPFNRRQRPVSFDELPLRQVEAGDHYVEAHFQRVKCENEGRIRLAVAEGFAEGAQFMKDAVL